MPAPDRTFPAPAPGRKIAVQLDPDDPDSIVELTLVEEFASNEWNSATNGFQRRIWRFTNTEDSERTIAIQEVFHKKRLPGLEWRGPDVPKQFVDTEDDDDEDAADDLKLKIEVITEASFEEGSGIGYQKRRFGLAPLIEDVLKFRNAHIKRIFRKDQNGDKVDDVWIDVLRTDQRVTFEGSGRDYKCRLETLLWDDVADDNTFDVNDLAADSPQARDDPVRTDPFQRIINWQLGKIDILLLIVRQAYTARDTFTVDPALLNATSEKKDADNNPLYPPIVDKDVTQSFQVRADAVGAPPSAPVTIVDPLSGAMKSRLMAWTRAAAVGTGQITSNADLSVNNSERINSVFINLKKFFNTKSKTVGAHGDVFVKFPEFNQPAFLYRIEWVIPPTGGAPALYMQFTPGDYFQFQNGRDSDIQFFADTLNALGATNIKILNVDAVGNDDYPFTVSSSHHLPAGTTLPGGGFSAANYYVPASFVVEAYTFRDVKDFPMLAGRVVIGPPDTQPEASGEADRSAVYQNPLEAGTVRVRVNFPDLTLEFETT